MNYKTDQFGNKFWYKEGKLYREDGPAVEWYHGTKEWYKDDKFHREDGPAVEDVNGNKWWYKEGLRHRLDGPAIEYINGTKLYFYLDKQIECNSNEEYFKLLKLKAFW